MKTALLITAAICLPATALIASSLTGIYTFGGVFFVCLITGFLIANAIEPKHPDDSKQEKQNKQI